jgi:hypothetical protein
MYIAHALHALCIQVLLENEKQILCMLFKHNKKTINIFVLNIKEKI